VNVAGHHDTAPDLGFDVEQADLEFIHLPHMAVPVSLVNGGAKLDHQGGVNLDHLGRCEARCFRLSR
jgi:hypothetical protein